jgi:DNA-binding response OmpR family regulator
MTASPPTIVATDDAIQDPAAPAAEAASTLEPQRSEDEPLRAYVLEDDPDIAALEADILRELGFNVVSCARIVDLGDLMAVALPHLLVVDVMLPDGDGGDIAELLRETWPGIPAVFVSAASRNRLIELAPLGPVVAKPFDIDRFREAVLTAVEAPADRWRIR